MKRCVILSCFLVFPLVLLAQWLPRWNCGADSLKKIDFHVSLGSSVSVGSGASVFHLGVAPRLDFHPSNRLKVSVGFSALNSIDPNAFWLQTNPPVSRAPLRKNALALSFDISASYWVNDRLRIAASLFHQNGDLLSPGMWSYWGVFPTGMPIHINRTGFAADLLYRFDNDNTIQLHLSIIRDRSYPPTFGRFYGIAPMAAPGCYPTYNCFDAAVAPWYFCY